jgi:predicted permease
MFGSLLIMICASMPAAVVFTTSSVVSILGASIVGALIFRERKTLTWYVTVAGCLAAVAFAGLAARTPAKAGYADRPAGVHSVYTLHKDARRGPDHD